MLRGKPLTAVIPVRGGSKGIPRKNLLRLGRDTLLERAIKLAAHGSRIDRTLVSTDDPEMHAVAQALNVAAPALRPSELAGDTVRSEDVVLHLLNEAGIEAGYILLLQVTTPLRTRADLEAACDLFEAEQDTDALVSVCAHTSAHPAKMFTIDKGRIAPFMECAYTGPRQSLPSVFVPNGAFYIIGTDTLSGARSFLPDKTLAFEMPPERSANLDSMQDLHILQAMLGAGHWTLEELD